ncbi:phage major capsid protein [Priestia aryabhattai]|jgi:HK97 family phage major capsid protein|uniref:phage major capsid protein n=1 Tax=Priestia aryabhattai TaxID=412384 RepID=UPI00203B01A7|nr:phage major capsid protein [Priestia aryabhattai]MCM3256088.1 phage major capsid protein [Priestia aryabhattai]
MKIEAQNGKELTVEEWKKARESVEATKNRPNLSPGNNNSFASSQILNLKQVKQDFKTLRTENNFDTLEKGTKTKSIYFVNKKALESYDFVSGGSLAPEGLTSEILRRQAIAAKIKSAVGFSTFDTKDISYPLDSTAWNAAIVEEGAVGPETTIATDRETLTPLKIMINAVITNEWKEDSFPDAFDQLATSIAEALARAEERLILLPATGGLQATARNDLADAPFDITTIDSAFTTETDVLEILTNLDTAYQANAEDIVWVADARLRPRMLSLPRFQEANNADSLAGSPILYTDQLAPDETGNLPIMAINKRAVRIGQRRGLTMTQIPERGDKNYMEVTMRSGMLLPFLDAGRNVGAAVRYFTV